MDVFQMFRETVIEWFGGSYIYIFLVENNCYLKEI